MTGTDVYLIKILTNFFLITCFLQSLSLPIESQEISECSKSANCTCTQHKNEWSATCDGMPMILNGKIRSISVIGNLTILSKLSTMSLINVRKLNLTNCGVSYIEEAFIKVNGFQVIDLSKNKIDSVNNHHFIKLLQLEELYLNNNQIKVIESESFVQLEKLKFLYLNNNQLKEITFFTNMPANLMHLDLSDNFITELPTTSKTNLQVLNLCGNQIDKAIGLGNFEKLKEICLTGVSYLPNKGLSETIEKLTLISNSKGLLMNQLTPSMQTNIAKMKNITFMHLEMFEIYTFEFLEELANLTTLELININTGEKAQIGDIFKNAMHLATLNLDSSPYLAHQLLATFNVIPNLVNLSLKHCNITTLHTYESVKHLKQLDLRENPLNCTRSNWNWLKDTDKDVYFHLINTDDLICDSPNEFHGELLVKSLNIQFSNRNRSYETMKEIPEGLQAANEFDGTSYTIMMYSLVAILSLVILILGIYVSIRILRGLPQFQRLNEDNNIELNNDRRV